MCDRALRDWSALCSACSRHIKHVHIYIYTYIHIYIYTHMYICMNINIYVCMNIHTYIKILYIYACVYLYIQPIAFGVSSVLSQFSIDSLVF